MKSQFFTIRSMFFGVIKSIFYNLCCDSKCFLYWYEKVTTVISAIKLNFFVLTCNIIGTVVQIATCCHQSQLSNCGAVIKVKRNYV